MSEISRIRRYFNPWMFRLLLARRRGLVREAELALCARVPRELLNAAKNSCFCHTYAACEPRPVSGVRAQWCRPNGQGPERAILPICECRPCVGQR